MSNQQIINLPVRHFEDLYNEVTIFRNFFPLVDTSLEFLTQAIVEDPSFHTLVEVPRVFFISMIAATVMFSVDPDNRLHGVAKMTGTLEPKYRSPGQVYPFSIDAHFEYGRLVGNYNFYYRTSSIIDSEDESNYQTYIFSNREVMSLETSVFLGIVEMKFKPNNHTIIIASLSREKYPTLNRVFRSWSFLRYSDHDTTSSWADKIQSILDFKSSEIKIFNYLI